MLLLFLVHLLGKRNEGTQLREVNSEVQSSRTERLLRLLFHSSRRLKSKVLYFISITQGVLAQSPELEAQDKVFENNPDRIGIWKCWREGKPQQG